MSASDHGFSPLTSDVIDHYPHSVYIVARLAESHVAYINLRFQSLYRKKAFISASSPTNHDLASDWF